MKKAEQNKSDRQIFISVNSIVIYMPLSLQLLLQPANNCVGWKVHIRDEAIDSFFDVPVYDVFWPLDKQNC